jgi:hypothetical protein
LTFSISGDEAKTVKIKLNSVGRTLLSTGHGRLVSARLRIRELGFGAVRVQTKNLWLVEKGTSGKK